MSVQLFAIKVVDCNIDANQVDWRFVFAGSKDDAASKVATEKPGRFPSRSMNRWFSKKKEPNIPRPRNNLTLE